MDSAGGLQADSKLCLPQTFMLKRQALPGLECALQIVRQLLVERPVQTSAWNSCGLPSAPAHICCSTNWTLRVATFQTRGLAYEGILIAHAFGCKSEASARASLGSWPRIFAGEKGGLLACGKGLEQLARQVGRSGPCHWLRACLAAGKAAGCRMQVAALHQLRPERDSASLCWLYNQAW